MSTPSAPTNPPAVPDISENLPTRINRTQQSFNAVASAWYNSLPNWQAGLEALAAWQKNCADLTYQYMCNAQQAVADAAQQAVIATQRRDEASVQADRAIAAADQSYASANFVGHWSDQAGVVSKPISVAHNKTVWLSLQTDFDVGAVEPGVSALTADYWLPVGIPAPVGTIEYRNSDPEPGWLPMDGSSYLRSAYPELAEMYPQWSYAFNSVFQLGGGAGHYRNLTFNADSTLLFGVQNTSSYRFWEIPGGSVVSVPLPNSNTGFYSAEFHPVIKHDLIVSVNKSGGGNELIVFDISNPASPIAKRSVTADYALLIEFNRDGSQVVFARAKSASGSAVYDYTDFLTPVFPIPGSSAAAYSPTSDLLAVANNLTKRLEIYETNNWTKTAESPEVFTGNSESGSLRNLMWGGDYIVLITTVDGGNIYCFHAETLEIVGRGDDIKAGFGSSVPPTATITDDGAYLFCDNADGSVFELPTFKEVSLPSFVQTASSCRFSPNGKYLAGSRSINGTTLAIAKRENEIALPDLPSGINGVSTKVRGKII